MKTAYEAIEQYVNVVKDEEIKPIIFAIRDDFLRNLCWPVLPGAPMAFAKWNYSGRAMER